MSKEFAICLKEEKIYFPGDIIKGHIKLDLKKSADIQLIKLNFKGTVEGQGEKVVLIDQTEILASPTNGQKYTTFAAGKIYQFDFEFKIPINKSLPSFAKIPKIVNISYFLIATPKKPSFNFSQTLPAIVEEVKLLDLINVDLPDFCRQVNMNTDLGFTNGCKSTQWNLVIPKSAFIRGDNIELECNINNFPPMKKLKAIKVSLIRYVYKTSLAKIEKKVLSTKTIDLHVTEIASTQSVYIELHVPPSTPASVFPDNGRILSISYIIQAELNMKSVKAAIKLKDMYAHEAAIVIGTFLKADDYSAIIAERKDSIAVTNRTITNTMNNYRFQNFSAASLPTQQQRPLPPRNFHSVLTDMDVKPLARLDEGQLINNSNYRRSYLSRDNSPSSASKPFFSHDGIPRTLTLPTNMRLSYLSSQSPSPPIIDRSLTPLPSVNMNIGYKTISYTNRCSGCRGPIMLQPSSSNKDNVIVSLPHEIGPDDIINRGDGNVDSRVCTEYFNNDNEKVISDTNYDDEKEGQTSPQVPSLIRHDTVSTASSGGLIEDQLLYNNIRL